MDNLGGKSLFADGIHVEGGAFFRKSFSSVGELRLLGAVIGGNLEFDGSYLENPGAKALSADELRSKGSVFLRDGFLAKGEVRLIGSRIEGSTLDFDGGRFENPNGIALNVELIQASGSVYLRRGFYADGEVRFFCAQIAGNLECSNATFSNPNGNAFLGQGMDIGGIFVWRNMKGKPSGTLNLVNVQTSGFADDRESWPTQGHLDIDGFNYRSISRVAPIDAQTRLEWLALAGPENFSTQPFEQIVQVIKRMGKDEEARKIAIGKQRALRRYGGLSRWGKIWNGLLDVTSAYGYRPFRVIFLFILPIVIIGAAIFQLAFNQQLLVSSGQPFDVVTGFGREIPNYYPAFDPVAYSADLFVPVIDLKIASHWIPSTTTSVGQLLRVYSWIHILLGWFFSTLTVASVAGLIRKD